MNCMSVCVCVLCAVCCVLCAGRRSTSLPPRLIAFPHARWPLRWLILSARTNFLVCACERVGMFVCRWLWRIGWNDLLVCRGGVSQRPAPVFAHVCVCLCMRVCVFVCARVLGVIFFVLCVHVCVYLIVCMGVCLCVNMCVVVCVCVRVHAQQPPALQAWLLPVAIRT
jgi:hypothetical protein